MPASEAQIASPAAPSEGDSAAGRYPAATMRKASAKVKRPVYRRRKEYPRLSRPLSPQASALSAPVAAAVPRP